MAARRWAPTLLATTGLVVVVAGFVAGSEPLVDNSFLTHLATGRAFWDGHGLPREDPYTFTAAGEPWVVQSWLASVLYGGLDRVGGLEAIRLLTAATTALLAALAWHLSAPARTLTARLLLVLPVLLVGFAKWSERPLLFGLASLAVVLLAAEGRFDPRWLVPVLWVWVNTHGSWPLGFVVVGLLLVGRVLDREPAGIERRVLLWMLVGAAVGSINPYGPRILAFPFQLLGQREAIAELREWQPAGLTEPTTLAVLLLGAFVALALTRRWRWRTVLPAAGFLVAGLTSARNLVPAAFVLLAVAAPGLEGLGSIDGKRSDGRLRLVWAAGAALTALLAVGIVTGDPFDDSPYPVAAERFLREEGIDPRTHRVIARDYVGNWLEARYGPTGMVYMDDRVEVLPLEAIQEHDRLLDGADDWEAILDRLEPAAVLWRADDELATLLAEDGSWSVTYDDGEWVVAVPRR